MLNNRLLNELIKYYDINNLEKHILYSYMKFCNLEESSNPLLKNYFSGFEIDSKLYLDCTSLNITTIKELENSLELLIPAQDKKLNGAFFTPDYIIDFMIKEINPKEYHKNIDLSCGCGAFLIGLVDYYRKYYKKSFKSIIKNNIYGSDILKYNIDRTKLILTVYALQIGEILIEEDFNLYHQDSLRFEWKDKYDNIIGNPPYVKFQDLSDNNRDFLSKNWLTIEGGTFNLYFAFFELGYELLKSTGKLIYITPNNYFTSLSGESLRKYFHKNKCIKRIIDFNHKKVFAVQTYTAITFINKKKNDRIKYDRILDNQKPDDFLKRVNGSYVNLLDLNVKKWRLLKNEEKENINIIENIGIPIGKLFDICVGVATLKDEVYYVDSSESDSNYFIKTTANGRFKIEKEILKSVYKISDFKKQEDLNLNSRKIICPYYLKNGNAFIIEESNFKKKYPKCYDYLLSEKNNLIERDKGKTKYYPFYAWGRTQGLTKFGVKIITPTFSQHPRFLLIKERESYYTNGYGIFFKDEIENKENKLFAEDKYSVSKIENIDITMKILNSFIMDYYISKTSVSIDGGYPCFQKNFIENFTIPDFTDEEIIRLRNLSIHNDINEFLIKKYQLNVLVGNLV